MRFVTEHLKPRPEFTVDLLVKTMKIYSGWHSSLLPAKKNKSEQKKATSKGRKKCITIDDSHSNYYGHFEKKSSIITARNPFKKDDQVLDYEMDSEDEWAEENGEDIDKKDIEEEQEDEEMANEDDEEPGFIVSDGHLSVCEYDFSDGEADDEKKQKEIALRRERLKLQ